MTPGPEQVRPSWSDALSLLRASTARVLATVSTFDDAALRQPSVLPGWTRGHVVAHLARNADALGNLVRWASTGVETPAYASPAARDADIEAGAALGRDALLADLASASERLAAGLDGLDATQREVRVRLRDGAALAARTLPTIRVRELEIHHVDLLAGYTPADWPTGFVTVTLDKLAPGFAARDDVAAHRLVAEDGASWTVGPPGGPSLHGRRADLLVWLVGRALPVTLRAEPPGAIPRSPVW